MAKLENFSDISKENQEKNKNNSLKINRLENENGSEFHSEKMTKILDMERQIAEIASKDVLMTPALFSLLIDDDCIPIILQGGLSLLQGKTGTHKSRKAENLCAAALSKWHKYPHDTILNRYLDDTIPNRYLGFVCNEYCVCVYLDTERSVNDEFPLAVQRIREKAGFQKTEQVPHFFALSLSQFERGERLEVIGLYLAYVQEQAKGKPIFVVIDVVTDCDETFNSDRGSMKMYDAFRQFSDMYNATFLLVIHENPFSEKARGHTGTEGSNKASTIMQIGFDGDSDNSQLLKVRFLKTRHSARPKPLYLTYSQIEKGLVLADEALIKKETDEKTKDANIAYLREFLENFLKDEPKDGEVVMSAVCEKFGREKRTMQDRIAEIIDEKQILYKNGVECFLEKGKNEKDKRKTVLMLTPFEPKNQTKMTL